MHDPENLDSIKNLQHALDKCLESIEDGDMGPVEPLALVSSFAVSVLMNVATGSESDARNLGAIYTHKAFLGHHERQKKLKQQEAIRGI